MLHFFRGSSFSRVKQKEDLELRNGYLYWEAPFQGQAEQNSAVTALSERRSRIATSYRETIPHRNPLQPSFPTSQDISPSRALMPTGNLHNFGSLNIVIKTVARKKR